MLEPVTGVPVVVPVVPGSVLPVGSVPVVGTGLVGLVVTVVELGSTVVLC